ncbi:MAG TPA: hypothetical protein VGZ00_12015 [Candidatus Baltobacteraceae bacterium]|nr:hypothetical protein [Candidatus Baltobacteraceae bacterium]
MSVYQGKAWHTKHITVREAMRGGVIRRGKAAFCAGAIIAGSLVALAGCAADPKAATTENFAHAIAERYAKGTNDDRGLVCLQDSMVLPSVNEVKFALANPKDADANPEADTQNMFDLVVRDPDGLTKLQVLASGGVLMKKPTTISGTRGTMFQPVKVRLPAFKYTLAQNDAGAYCYATLGIDHVENFSIPGDMMGHHITEVTYVRKIESVKEWAQNAQVRAAFPAIDKSLTEVKAQPAKTMLELTNNGWQ